MIVAHGLGGRADLPLPVWLIAYSAAFAVLIGAVALRILRPRPQPASSAVGSPAPAWVERTARVGRPVAAAVALVVFATTLGAAWFGPDDVTDNIAPTAFLVVFWAGLPIVSVVVGDVWRHANPLWTIAAGFDRIGRRDPESSTATGWWASHWPAAIGVAAFLWLETAYHAPTSTAAVATFLGLYSAAVLAGAATFGAGWVRDGDGFAALFSLMATLAPLHRDEDGRVRLRRPGAGVAVLATRPGTLGLLLVVIGATLFDGVSRTSWWSDVAGARRGWAATGVDTIGLLLVTATVAVVFLVACRGAAVLAGDDEDTAGRQARPWIPALVPITLGLIVAHHLSLLVFDGQAFVALLSDPFGAGWDLFGTADDTIDYTAVTAEQIALLQVAALVVGHLAAVSTVHDRSLRIGPESLALRRQTPVLAVVVVSVVAAVLLLLEA